MPFLSQRGCHDHSCPTISGYLGYSKLLIISRYIKHTIRFISLLYTCISTYAGSLCLTLQGRTGTPVLYGVEALMHIETACAGKLAPVETLDDNKYIFMDNDLTQQTSSPYNMLLKAAKFATKGKPKAVCHTCIN